MCVYFCKGVSVVVLVVMVEIVLVYGIEFVEVMLFVEVESLMVCFESVGVFLWGVVVVMGIFILFFFVSVFVYVVVKCRVFIVVLFVLGFRYR